MKTASNTVMVGLVKSVLRLFMSNIDAGFHEDYFCYTLIVGLLEIMAH